MKKIYKKPSAVVVNVKLLGSVLQDDPNPYVGGYSNTTQTGDGKQDDFSLDDDSFIPDLWGDDEEEDF